MNTKSTLLSVSALLLVGISTSHGVTSTWSGAAADGLWTTVGNWDIAPSGSEDIVFPGVANRTVDLVSGTYTIGSLTFDAPQTYTLANGFLNLGGDLSQNGAGTVDLNVDVDLGGANRSFGGSGSGVVNLNRPVTDNALFPDNTNRVLFTGGNWVIANSANTVDRFTVGSGATVRVAGDIGATTLPAYPLPWFLGGNGISGGYYAAVDGGTLIMDATQDNVAVWTGNTPTVSASVEWSDRGLIFGPNGGTVIWTNGAPMGGPGGQWYGLGGTGTVVIGQPLPYSGDPWDPVTGVDQFRTPFEVEYGIGLGPFNPGDISKWRLGAGDLRVILTNGACAYLDWSAMTNGNLIIQGHPGGDSSVIETNALGWTRNVGRFAIRGPHRGLQYSSNYDPNAPAWATPGTINRAFYMPQPYGIVFHDAVQVWNRDGYERLACDITVESGGSVDFCSGRRRQGLDLGHPVNATLGIGGPTNVITVKSGGNFNLNLQLRSNIGDSRTATNGCSSGMRVFSLLDIKDGGVVKIYRSQTNAFGKSEVEAGDTSQSTTRAATKAIELFRPIVGGGSSLSDARLMIDLPWSPRSRFALLDAATGNYGSNGKDGVNWEALPNEGAGDFPGALPIVNGAGRYGLRVEGKADYLTNFLFAVRAGSGKNALTGLTGSGGVLTIAATDATGEMTISEGPDSNPAGLRLGLVGDLAYTYNVNPGSVVNFAGLLLKKGRVKLGNGLDLTGKNLRVGDEGPGVVALDDASTVINNALVVIGDTTLEMGTTGGSGAILKFINTSATPWTAGKTLAIANWNGSVTGGGPDQVFFGMDSTGLTAAQLAQVKWVAPNGGADVTGAQILATGEIVPVAATAPTLSSPALVDGQFVFNVVPGLPTQTSIIQVATNLTAPVNWQNLVTNTGAFSFTNSIASPESYFRALAP